MNKALTVIILLFLFQSSYTQNNNPYQPDFRNKEYKKVIETAKKQLKTNPKDSMANYFIGYSYANLNQHKKAIKNFKIAQKNGLKGPFLILRLAQSYTADKQTEKALIELETLDSLNIGFYNQLEQPIFDELKANSRFKKIKNNMYKRANPCKFDANYRKFDFWLGEWDVFSQDQKIAESSITMTNGDCGILENWRPNGSNGGNSISYFDTSDKKWKQNWVAGGSVSHYEEPEDYTNGNIQLIAKGNGVWYKMIYTFDKVEDTVRQIMESSTDKGKTWTIVFNGLYKRKIN
ncbi:Tetratricopeptide repeat protein [Flavobacteriales bacterium ALC-1]|nr:Tetratricopeptide repeat protein [Flavobacteriales bacterium ALC-1]